MASRTSKDKPAPVPLVDFAADIAARRAAYEAKNGPLRIPRNKGNRRTESKKALLKAIEDAGGKW